MKLQNCAKAQHMCPFSARRLLAATAILLLLWLPLICKAQDDQSSPAQSSQADQAGNHNFERWNIHFQATSVAQHHGSFHSPYAGENSLPAHAENRVSLTTTAFLALRLNHHFEIVLNPEIAGGKGFGDVTGIAGFPNGEITRVAQATPKLYLARGFVQGTWALGHETEPVESDANLLAGEQPVRRFTVIVGKFAATDYFDVNAYSHDPRTQFLNWSLMYNGAWDYPADTRGYTVGTMQELTMRTWSLRLASVLEPQEANGLALDTRVTKNRGEAAEWELRYRPRGHQGKLRILGYLNRDHGGTFREALKLDTPPDLAPTRRDGTKKYGFGLNIEQSLTSDLGIFARYGWSDGKTEAWAFSQIDRSLSGGVSLNGRIWKRPKDTLGVATVRNYLSGDQRRFLAAGGLGFIIGDGALNYAPETVVEVYYAWHATRSWTVTADYQPVRNPADNRDRGPVSVLSLRLHWGK